MFYGANVILWLTYKLSHKDTYTEVVSLIEAVSCTWTSEMSFGHVNCDFISGLIHQWIWILRVEDMWLVHPIWDDWVVGSWHMPLLFGHTSFAFWLSWSERFGSVVRVMCLSYYRLKAMEPANPVKPLTWWAKIEFPCFYILSCSNHGW